MKLETHNIAAVNDLHISSGVYTATLSSTGVLHPQSTNFSLM